MTGLIRSNIAQRSYGTVILFAFMLSRGMVVGVLSARSPPVAQRHQSESCDPHTVFDEHVPSKRKREQADRGSGGACAPMRPRTFDHPQAHSETFRGVKLT